MRRAVALTVVLALAATACSAGSSREIARAGDHVITQQDLSDLFVSETAPVDDTLRSLIFLLSARAIFRDAIQAEFGIGVDQAEVDAEYQGLVDQMTASGAEPADFFGLEGAGDGMTRFQAELTVIYRTVVRGLVAQPGYIDTLFENPAPITTVCAKHILVATEEESLAVKARLEAGEDFATVADEVSTDTSSAGGDLGCNLVSGFVEPFGSTALAAPIGELTGPIETSFGWHVLIVSDRFAPTAAEIIADPLGKLPSSVTTPLWQTWYGATLQAATVTVDPEFGVWSPGGIVAPTTTTTTP